MPEVEEIQDIATDTPDGGGGGKDPLGLRKPVAKTDPLNLRSQPNKPTEPTQVYTTSQTTTKPVFDLQTLLHNNTPHSEQSPQGYISPMPSGGTTAEQYNQRVTDAANNVVKTFNENKGRAVDKIVKRDLDFKMKALQAQFENGSIDQKTYNAQRTELFNNILNPQPLKDQLNHQMSVDEGTSRRVLDEIAKSNPAVGRQLSADLYVMDSQKRPQNADKILFNDKQIRNKATANYDIRAGQLTRPEGFFQSIGTGFQQRNKILKDYDFFQNNNDGVIIQKMENDRAAYNPDQPQAVPSGTLGHIGSNIGSQGIVTAKGALAGGLTSLVPGVGEAAAPWVAAAVTSPEFYKTGWSSSFTSNYNDLRNKGFSPQEAITKARDRADFDAKVDVAQGAIGTAVGTRMGIKPIVGAELSPGYLNAVKDIAKSAGKWGLATSIEGGAQGALAGGLQALKNLHAGRPGEEGVPETMMSQLLFAYGLGALTKAGRALIKPGAHGAILDAMTKAPTEEIDKTLGGMVNDGSISPADAQDVHTQIEANRETTGKIPEDVVNEGSRKKIQELIDKRTSLEAKVETLDKAFHPAIKEQIDQINEQINKESQKGKNMATELGKSDKYDFVDFKEASKFDTPDAYLRDLQKRGIVDIDCG